MLLSILFITQLGPSLGNALHGLQPSFYPTAGLQMSFPSTDPTLRSFMPKPVIASLDNQCGRGKQAFLPAIAGTHTLPPYPAAAVHRGEEGDSRIQVVVDRNGNPGAVSVSGSSGFADLDAAAVAAVNKYRWAVPPRECREQGVQQMVKVEWTLDLPTIAIAFDSADYPAAAKAANLSGEGLVLVSQTGDTVTGIKMDASTGSPELDKAMMDFARAKIALPSLMRDGRALTTTMPYLFRFSADPARPGTPLTPNLPENILDEAAE